MNFSHIMVMLGGLGLFLFGMQLMSDGLELAAGSKLKLLIEKLTKNKYMGALVGMIVTAVIHSSAATTVMVVGFVNAGFMNLVQAAGVIMGANIGTCMTGLMIAIDLTAIAPAIVFIGVSILLFVKKNSYKNIGNILIGFGMLFMGLNMMTTSMEVLKESQELRSMIASFKNPFIGLFAGMLITALIHSSSAIVGILQSLGKAGVMTLSSSIFIIFGLEIGTCVTALIASVGATKAAKRAAVIHLLFNVTGAIVFVIITLLFPFTALIESIAPGNVVFQIPIIHTIFNVVATSILLPSSKFLIKISRKLVPGEEEVKQQCSLIYLDDRILNTPPIAVSQLLKEVERMANLAKSNFKHAMQSFLGKDKRKVEKVYANEETINFLNKSITEYLVKINGLDLSDKDKRLVGSLFHVINDIERVGDYCENICELSELLIDGRASLSRQAIREIEGMEAMVESILDEAVFMFSSDSEEENHAKMVNKTEDAIDEMTETLKQSHIERLNNGKCTAVAGTIFMEALTSLERIADHSTNIAFCNRPRLKQKSGETHVLASV